MQDTATLIINHVYCVYFFTPVPRRILKEIKNNNGEAYPNSFCDRNRNKEGGGSPPETETPSDGIPPTRRDGRRRPSTTTMMMTTTKAPTTTLATTPTTLTQRPTRRPTKVVKGEAGGGRGDASSSVHYDVITGVTGKPGDQGEFGE